MTKLNLSHIFKIAIVNLAVILFLFIILEVVVRAFGIPLYGSYHPMIFKDDHIRKHIPNEPYVYTIEGYSKGVFNSHGYLDYERSITKPPETFRIAVLGDSITEAIQVPMEENFCSLLEKKLNNYHSQKCEVLNFGISGYTTSDEYLLLKKEIVEYNPDLVILAFTALNDVETNYSYFDGPKRRIYFKIEGNGNLLMDDSYYNAYLNSPEGRLRLLLDGKSRVFRMFLSLYRNLALYKKGLNDEIFFFPDSPLFYDEISEDYKIAWKITEELLAKIKDYVESKEARFILISFPVGWQLYSAKTWSRHKPSSHRDKPEEILYEISQRRDIEYLNLLPIFLEKKNKEKVNPYFIVDNTRGHFNRIGHKWASEAMFNYITNSHSLVQKAEE